MTARSVYTGTGELGAVSPSREVFRELAEGHRVIPVARRLLADDETPIGLYRKLAGDRAGTFLLESAENGRSWSRWSFVGAHCAATLTEVDGQATWLGTPPVGLRTGGDPLEALRQAVEELRTSRERKAYLDSQATDLEEAVTTLEDAIRKIDRETRELLRETFEAVNRHFGSLFPSLFGGGEAKLIMTGEEILDAGVQVMAQPPGKRNTSIHLLSGGEKALTAIALVFSLFQLNPAPFCLLDEVDAPLDDSNTVRFCELVRKMSAQTQFLFISHNKITMELAEQLIGVTMPESGVSRVVAVDIDEALRIREELAA